MVIRFTGLAAGALALALAAVEACAWTTPADITNWPDYECGPRTGRDSLNKIHLVWFGGAPDSAGWRIYYQVYGGANWSGPTPISGSNASTPDIAVDGADNLHVVWHAGGNPEDIYYRKCTGGVWGGTTNLSNSAGVRSLTPRVAVDSTGNDLLVVWHDYDNIYYCEKRNGSWRPWYVVSSGTYQTAPCVTVDGNSRAHLTWQCRMPGSWDVWWCRQDLDVTPPPAPINFAATGSNGKVYLSWKNPSDVDFKGTMVRYSTSGYPASPTDGYPACDVPGTPGSNGSFVHEGLANGVTHYYSAFSYDAVPNYSAAAHGSATPALMSIAYAKREVADGQTVDLCSKVVTANFASSDGCIYVQEQNRASGIRVDSDDSSLNVGDIVNVSGTISTRVLSGYPAERYLSGATVNRLSSGAAPKPLAMNCRSVGGTPLCSLVPGVKNGIGPSNMGLLVRISGKVTYATGSYLYVDDGSEVENLYGLYAEKVGVMVKCPGTTSVVQGDSVSVSGIVEGSIPNNPEWTTNRAYVHMRDWPDLMKR